MVETGPNKRKSHTHTTLTHSAECFVMGKVKRKETHSEKRDGHARYRTASKRRTEIQEEVLFDPWFGSPVYIDDKLESVK